MLADTVESAVRSLKEPTPTSIRNMVLKLVVAARRTASWTRAGSRSTIWRRSRRNSSRSSPASTTSASRTGQEEKEGEAVVHPA